MFDNEKDLYETFIHYGGKDDELINPIHVIGSGEDGEIIIISVAAKLRRVQFESRRSIREANEKAIEEAEGYVAKMKAKFDDSYNVTTKVVTGFPSEAINQLAEDVGADLIIISASGKSGLKKFVIGSVAENVLANADCDVLLVHLEE